jgi:hypothetical protein
VVELETVRVTVATTPFEIGVSFKPYKTQVAVPGVLVHDTVLFTAVAAGPASTLTDEKSAVE